MTSEDDIILAVTCCPLFFPAMKRFQAAVDKVGNRGSRPNRGARVQELVGADDSGSDQQDEVERAPKKTRSRDLSSYAAAGASQIRISFNVCCGRRSA